MMRSSTPLTFPPYRPFPQDGGMKGSRAYLYCRVAHNDGFSLELQKEELLRFAERAGLEIVGISAEYAGGRILDRGGLNEVSQAICSGKADIVLVKSTSRIARDMPQFQEYNRFLDENGAMLCCMQEQLVFGGRYRHAEN